MIDRVGQLIDHKILASIKIDLCLIDYLIDQIAIFDRLNLSQLINYSNVALNKVLAFLKCLLNLLHNKSIINVILILTYYHDFNYKIFKNLMTLIINFN